MAGHPVAEVRRVDCNYGERRRQPGGAIARAEHRILGSSFLGPPDIHMDVAEGDSTGTVDAVFAFAESVGEIARLHYHLFLLYERPSKAVATNATVSEVDHSCVCRNICVAVDIPGVL